MTDATKTLTGAAERELTTMHANKFRAELRQLRHPIVRAFAELIEKHRALGNVDALNPIENAARKMADAVSHAQLSFVQAMNGSRFAGHNATMSWAVIKSADADLTRIDPQPEENPAQPPEITIYDVDVADDGGITTAGTIGYLDVVCSGSIDDGLGPVEALESGRRPTGLAADAYRNQAFDAAEQYWETIQPRLARERKESDQMEAAEAAIDTRTEDER